MGSIAYFVIEFSRITKFILFIVLVLRSIMDGNGCINVRPMWTNVIKFCANGYILCCFTKDSNPGCEIN